MRILSRFSWSRVLVRRVGAAGAVMLLAACGGGGGGSMSPGIPGTTPAPTAKGTSSVTWVMHWSSTTPSSSRRAPKYLAPTALSASIAVLSAPAPFTTTTPVISVLNSPTSTLVFSAPNGQDTFLVQTYDEQNAQGNILSKAIITQTVSSGQANVVSATLNGVIAATSLQISPLPFTAGNAASATVSATGFDADGNAIVGPGTFDTPIQLSIVDPANSGALSLSLAVIQAPGNTVTLNYNGATLISASVLASTSTLAKTSSVVIAPTPNATLFTIPTALSSPLWITFGYNLVWFTEENGNKIGKFAFASQSFTEFTIPTANSEPNGITLASDGNFWFAEYNSSKIGRMTQTGSFSEFGTLFGNDRPVQVADRGDGTVWYTAFAGNHVGYQSFNGVAGETTIPTGTSAPFGVAEGPDLNLYFTEYNAAKIGRLANLFATIQELTLPGGSTPYQIVRGPDGGMWFTDPGLSEIGRVNPGSFTATYYLPASPNAIPKGITVGPDGALWFTESGLDRIGRMTTSGVASEYSLPGTNLGLEGIVTKPNGTIWFVASNTNQIGVLQI